MKTHTTFAVLFLLGAGFAMHTLAACEPPEYVIRHILSETHADGRTLDYFEIRGYRCFQPDDVDRPDDTWGHNEFALLYPVGYDRSEGGSFPVVYFMKGGPPGWVDTSVQNPARPGISWGSESAIGRFRGFIGHAQRAWSRGKILNDMVNLDADIEGVSFLTKLRHAHPSWGFVVPTDCSNDGYVGKGELTPNGRRYGLKSAVAALRYVEQTHGLDYVYGVGNSAGGIGAVALGHELPKAMPELEIRGLISSNAAFEVEPLRLMFEEARTHGGFTQFTEPNGQTVWTQCADDWQPWNIRTWRELSMNDTSVWSASTEIRDGKITAPILHLWNQHDTQFCGNSERSDATLHGPIAAALDEVNPSGLSQNMPVCVGDPILACADPDPPQGGVCDQPVELPCGTHGLLGRLPSLDSLHADLLAWIDGVEAAAL